MEKLSAIFALFVCVCVCVCVFGVGGGGGGGGGWWGGCGGWGVGWGGVGGGGVGWGGGVIDQSSLGSPLIGPAMQSFDIFFDICWTNSRTNNGAASDLRIRRLWTPRVSIQSSQNTNNLSTRRVVWDYFLIVGKDITKMQATLKYLFVSKSTSHTKIRCVATLKVDYNLQSSMQVVKWMTKTRHTN